MQIREMKKEDMKRILDITRIAWEKYTIYHLIETRHGRSGSTGWCERKMKDIESFCETNPEDVIVAEENGKVVGYATFGMDFQCKVESFLNNAVDPAFQGKGIGSAMNAWILDCLRKEGLLIARVITMEHNKAARRMYERNGFKELARSIYYTLAL